MFLRICQIPGKTWGCFLKDNFWGLIQLINVCRIMKYLAQLFPLTAAVCRICHPKQKKPPQASFPTFLFGKVVYFFFITFCCLHYPLLMQKLKKKNALPHRFYRRIYLCVFVFSHIKMKSLDSLCEWEKLLQPRKMCVQSRP